MHEYLSKHHFQNNAWQTVNAVYVGAICNILLLIITILLIPKVTSDTGHECLFALFFGYLKKGMPQKTGVPPIKLANYPFKQINNILSQLGIKLCSE